MYTENSFITLTYDEKRQGYHNEFDYSEIQRFKKRLRQEIRRKHKKKIEIFNVHEYGRNGKKHWHLIVFNYGFPDKEKFPGSEYYTSQELKKLWPYGYNSVGDVSEASAMYQAQYLQKDIKNGNSNNSKRSHSKHSGIGKAYFRAHWEQLLRLGYIPFNTRKMPLPRYYERMAHKHYSHFYEPENFSDHRERKKLYSPFKESRGDDGANRALADAYIDYKKRKDQKINDLTKEWEEYVEQYLKQENEADFVKSGANALYDLNKNINQENF